MCFSVMPCRRTGNEPGLFPLAVITHLLMAHADAFSAHGNRKSTASHDNDQLPCRRARLGSLQLVGLVEQQPADNQEREREPRDPFPHRRNCMEKAADGEGGANNPRRLALTSLAPKGK